MAKKIMALVMTIALVVCFAVSASAAVITETKYIAGETAQAEVTVTVSGVTAGNNVTYYAKNVNGDVYVNQEMSNGANVVFNYITAHANVGSDVIIGYTNVENADKDTIPDAAKYTITYGGTVLASVYENNANVSFAYTLGQYKNIADVTATNADVDWNFENNEITAILTNIKGDVELSVVEGDEEIEDFGLTLDIDDAAAIVATGRNDGVVVGDETIIDETVNAAEGDRKLTVCGKIGAVDAGVEYGIIVSTTPIEAEELRPAAFAKYNGMTYKAIDKSEDGLFAVQLIDESDNGAFVAVDVDYYTAVYAKTADACYVVPFGTAVKAN